MPFYPLLVSLVAASTIQDEIQEVQAALAYLDMLNSVVSNIDDTSQLITETNTFLTRDFFRSVETDLPAHAASYPLLTSFTRPSC
jgi:hypothetical protein